MAINKPCPLDPKIFEGRGKMGLTRVKAIESHISAVGTCCHAPLKELVLKGSHEGSTPLLLACADGNLVVVKRIVERWGVKVDAAATYYYHLLETAMGRLYQAIEGATPLFVAALNGHDPVVRYLVDKGADVSVRTAFSNGRHSGMTPLYAALTTIHHRYNSELRVTSPLREKKTAAVRFLLHSGADPSALPHNSSPTWTTPLCNSNVTTITQLIHHGMSLAQRNPINGETVLHHWAGCPLGVAPTRKTRATEEGSPLTVVKLLVEKGADLMAVDNDGFTPILKAVHGFLARTCHESLAILDFLLDLDGIDLKEKIQALELIGAAILVSGSEDLFSKAFNYWRRALHLREMEKEGSEPLIKIAMKRKSGLTVEWVTSAELEHVIQHPSEHLIQSFLIGLRIYSSKSCRAFCGYVSKFLKYHCWPLMGHQDKFVDEVFNLLWAALEMILNFQPQEGESTWSTSARIVRELVWKLCFLQSVNPQLLKIETIQTSLELILSVEQRHVSSNKYHQGTEKDLKTLLELFRMLTGRPDLLNQEMKQVLVELVRLKRSAGTLLHPACKNIVANRAIIPLLLMFGVDTNIGDSDGNGPLHLILSQYINDAAIHEERVLIARLLMDNGAHLDRVNNDGETAVDLWTKARNKFAFAPKLSRLPDWCYESIPKLMCLSSRIIRSHKIFYSAKTLPIILHKFVQMH